MNTGFVRNRSFNAISSVAAGQDFIGIYIGAIEIIHNAFFNLLAMREIFPGIGNPSAERPDIGPANLVDPMDARPLDPARAKAAQDMAFCACLILFYHELSHIELCHVPFLIERLGVTEHCEVQAAPVSREHVWLYRTLENDADISGAVTSARIWRYWYDAMSPSHLEPIGWDRSWIVAAHVLYWVMELVHPARKEGVALTHPAPYFRLVSVMDVASEYGGISKHLTDDELKHDNLVPWIALQANALGRPVELVTDEAMSIQTNALLAMYRRIADRLEELQDARSQRTGRKIDRPDYPGTGWARQWR